MPAGSYKFISFVQARQISSANNEILFPQAQRLYSYLTGFKSFTSLDEVPFSSFSHTVSTRFNELFCNKCDVVSRVIISKKVF